jgi:hypothetical protein
MHWITKEDDMFIDSFSEGGVYWSRALAILVGAVALAALAQVL